MTEVTLVVVGVLALVLLSVGIAALVVLHIVPTGYSPVRDAVSDYGVGRYAWAYRIQVVSIGSAAAVEAGGFAIDGSVATTGIAWLAVYAVSRVAIAWAPTDLPGTQRTTTGRVHGLLAVVAFTSIAVATSTIPNDLQMGQGWAGWVDLLTPLGVFVMVAAIATAVVFVVTPLHRVFGLAERLLYVASLA